MNPETQDGLERAFPFYVVCDVSQSMWKEGVYKPATTAEGTSGRTPYDALREAVPDLLWKLEVDTTTSEAAHISIVTFAQDAQTFLPLTRPEEVQDLGELPKGAQTDFAKVFAHLATIIQADCAALEREYALKRPAVFFLTDGDPYVGSARQPDDRWLPERDRLAQLPYEPQIVAFGFGNIRPATLLRMATTTTLRDGTTRPLAFTAEEGTPVSTLVEGLIGTLFVTIGASVSGNGLDVRVPEGMRWLTAS
ncbi:vWA domain-containing protein [Streptomyces antibioticus]|uniref:vWA domain-containing protein n=1 Tax=Streptomyces antibioticus TaxID=1890 RepID=UPI00224ECC2F|nr:VWA domain-containing protein [Streptomyces antibioticus]MCX4741998.1 VWA domain-containing protein [Streptomyces antibioticus]MCX5172576.1 VWA domain-containing protein [Streptomyces antibioticus]